MSTPPDNRTTGTERPLCLCVSREWGAPENYVEMVAEAGWNGWFAVWRPEADLRLAAARGAAVGLDEGVGPHGGGDAGEDVGDDRAGVLGARVVGGDDQLVGQLGAGGAHEGALGAVAVAAGAEDGEEAGARELAERA